MSRCAYVQIEEEQAFRTVVPDGLAVHVGDLCIIEVGQFNDMARVIEIEDEVPGEGVGADVPKVLRCATLQDQSKAAETALRSKMATGTCEELITKHKLEIRLIKVRFTYDMKLLHVVFVAEERIDYREYIKELSSELSARVEMKQIGVRDQAGMIGGMGSCGRELCCCSWLKHFDSINVKMAKCQRLSLNPVAISGQCGRLKCCLRYENDQYIEADTGLPKDGEKVGCPDGNGCVCGKDILRGKVKLRMEDNRIMQYDVSELEKLR